MTKQELIDLRNKLFNEDFSIKSGNVQEIISFCNFLTQETGIQCCNTFGYINELLPKLYVSVLNTL